MSDTITIIDDRTGKQITVPIDDGVFPSSALRSWTRTSGCTTRPSCPPRRARQRSPTSTVMRASSATAATRSSSWRSTRRTSRVAYLLLNGELPTADQLQKWTYEVIHHTFLHDNVRKRFMEGFHYDAHPMGMFVSGLAAMSTYYPEAKDIFDQGIRAKQVLPAHRQDADAGRVLPSLQHRDCRPSTPTTRSPTRRTSST